ncbi:hypothetical protein NJ7G_3076 [Natrinema sp. J7-2]|nr:hypothetical protein NJ7G_3076 [Natrinema sp. J7-2]
MQRDTCDGSILEWELMDPVLGDGHSGREKTKSVFEDDSSDGYGGPTLLIGSGGPP